MGKVTARQLRQETKNAMNQLGQGKPLAWDDIMGEVWRAQKRVKLAERLSNPVLKERQRRAGRI